MFDDIIQLPVSYKDFPMFFDDPPKTKRLCKIYNDGNHYIASLACSTTKFKHKQKSDKKELDYLFDSLYFNGLQEGLKGGNLTEYLHDGILKLFPATTKLHAYIERKTKSKLSNLHHRKKRFRRKANLNPWTHFVTITYDDIKHDENSFRKKLRRCLSNLHTRRGWKYMGVFERAPETNRLHFHGMLYIPPREMIGHLTEKTDYDTIKGKVQITVESSFFLASFGRNDFKELNMFDLKHGNTLNYLLKYIDKTNERIVYSRGIPSEFYKEIHESDIATQMLDFMAKFILFDDVIDWELDVAKLKYKKQMTFTDLICNPS